MTESQVLNKIVARLKSIKRSGEPIWWAKLHGSPLQQRGLADLVICYRDKTLWVEVKRPGGKATEYQKMVGDQIAATGNTWTVVDSPEKIDDILVQP